MFRPNCMTIFRLIFKRAGCTADYTQWRKKNAFLKNNCNFFIFNIKKLC